MTMHDTHRRLWGKYRGKVRDNKDPLGIGRIQALVPAIAPDALNWAMPCTPYAGPEVGFFMIPPVGANVWIEFEGGDANYPIWSGCFWGDDQQKRQKPPTDANAPDVKVLQTEKLVLILDDQKGKLTAKLKDKSEKGDGETISLVMDKSGIVLTAKQVTVTITPDHIELKKGNATIEVAEAITLKKSAATIEVSSNITLKNGGPSAELSPSALNLKNGAASVSMSPAAVNINNGALEII